MKTHLIDSDSSTANDGIVEVLDEVTAPEMSESGQQDGGSPQAELPSPTYGIDMSRLIGKSHLFGRVKHLREGVLIEPVGTMTLQPDGRVSGYGHANEDTWIPYSHSPVESHRAFAFLTAQNKWIPSSTWTQSMGDIPIGHFCDEPELVQSAQQLCLLPLTRLPASSVVIYLVASCLRFYERTVPLMLAQLAAEGIGPSRIKVVVNGCAADSSRTIDGVDYAFSTHDGWEWSALYEAPLRWKFTYAFLIHDTSVVFPGFRRSVEAVNAHVAWDFMPASPMARCLLGLYSHAFLMRCNDWLKRTDRIDKRNGVLAEVAGELLLRARSALVIGDLEMNGGARAAEFRETSDYFHTGSPRVRRVFPAVKVHKFIHTGSASAEQL